MRRVSVFVGLAQAFALVIFGISVVVNAHRAHSTVGQPTVMAVIFLIFAAGLAKLAVDQNNSRTYARTPFGLMEVFAAIVGYTVLVGSSSTDHVVGAVILTSAVVGLVGLGSRR